VTCKAVDKRLSDRKDKIRPFLLSNVPYEAERRGNGLFWNPRTMYPHSQEWHLSREATVHLLAASIEAEMGLGLVIW